MIYRDLKRDLKKKTENRSLFPDNTVHYLFRGKINGDKCYTQPSVVYNPGLI